MKLGGQVAIVTGAASGIGRAIAFELAREGVDVAIGDIDLEGAQGVARELEALGRRSLALRADVGRSQEVNNMARTVLESLGRIDILVNNAGGSARERSSLFCKSSEEVWDEVLSKNLKGVMNCSRAVINHMMDRGSGNIVNIASVAGIHGTPRRAEYSAAKGAIIAFTKALAKEVASHGIRINSVSPGVIDTVMLRQIPPQDREALLKEVPPVGRLGKPEDIAHMVAFLVSEDAAFITGQNYVVDGGWYI
jgi:3-oxoacyl-[acyl-carrier protein] reductase